VPAWGAVRLEGQLSPRAWKLVQEWAMMHKEELEPLP